jgi:hypothetical protein
MPTPELRAWMEQVIAGTTAGIIKWKAANPTTYTWDVPPPKMARVILQRVERIDNPQVSPGRVEQRKVSFYLLHVLDLGKPQLGQVPVLTLNGSEDSEGNAQLDRLFEIITAVITRETFDFLNSLLPGQH